MGTHILGSGEYFSISFLHTVTSDEFGSALYARFAGKAGRLIRPGCYPNAKIHANEDAGWGVYANQELIAGDEIALG